MPAAWVFSHQTIRLLAQQITQQAISTDAVQRTRLLPTVSSQLADRSATMDTASDISFQQARVHGSNLQQLDLSAFMALT